MLGPNIRLSVNPLLKLIEVYLIQSTSHAVEFFLMLLAQAILHFARAGEAGLSRANFYQLDHIMYFDVHM